MLLTIYFIFILRELIIKKGYKVQSSDNLRVRLMSISIPVFLFIVFGIGLILKSNIGHVRNVISIITCAVPLCRYILIFYCDDYTRSRIKQKNRVDMKIFICLL